MTGKEALQRLQDGNNRFVEDKLDGELNNSSRRKELTGGQAPYAIVLSCADSRVVPELAFDTGLGEIFVIRVAGNVANTETLASIEYAVAHLNTKLIMVLGHQSCGAVTAAINGGNNGYNLNMLLAQITPAIDQAGENASINDVICKNAELVANDLVDRSPIIADAAKNKDLKIVSAYYNLDSGKVDLL